LSSPHGRPKKWHRSIECGSKINLHLKVTGRRPDGMHDLSSCFLFLNHPGDRLEVTGGEGSMTLECPGFPELANENNLLWRAGTAFAQAAGIKPEWKLVLEKKVPLAAGLGGGSADAGALLKLLNEYYSALDEENLTRLAFSLGADVPFFLHRRAAWVTGAGEYCRSIGKLPEIPHILIVNPGFPVSAKWAYSHLPAELIGADDPSAEENFVNGSVDWQEFCINDLAPAIFRKFPLLEIIKEQLYADGALAVQISGSGPSLFALFESADESAAAAVTVKKRFGAMEGMKFFTAG